MSKKGLMLLHWILVILVGAVIIIFAVVFASKTGVVEQKKQNVVVAEYMDLFFNPFASIGAIAEGFGKQVEFDYEVELEFRCVSGEERLFVGSGNKIAEEKIENFVYAPTQLKLKSMFVFSKPFNLPYRITDLIFTFDASQQFCLVYDSKSSEIVADIISDVSGELLEAEQNFISCSDLNCCKQLENARIVSFTSRQGDVNIAGKGGFGEEFEYGEIRFRNGKKSVFIGLPLVEAAVFSDYEIYDCNFRRLMSKVAAMSDIYHGKSVFLGRTQICSYDFFRDDLQKMKGNARSLSSSPSLSIIEPLYTTSREFSDRNRDFSCAQLY